MSKIQVLVVSDCRVMMAGFSSSIRNEKTEVCECFFEGIHSIQLMQPLYKVGFELVIIGFRDMAKASNAAVWIGGRMPGTPLIAVFTAETCAKSMTILKSVAMKVITTDNPLAELARIVAQVYDALFVSIRRADPLTQAADLTDVESRLIYCLQTNQHSNKNLAAATGVTKGVIDRSMRNLAEKTGTTDRLSIAVATFRQYGELRLTSGGDIVVPDRPIKQIFDWL